MSTMAPMVARAIPEQNWDMVASHAWMVDLRLFGASRNAMGGDSAKS
jgi:hypothetical protein